MLCSNYTYLVPGIFLSFSTPPYFSHLQCSFNTINSIQFGRVKNCLSPEWIEPIYLENLDDTHILVEVWDDNRGKEEDVLMGKTLVNIKEALEQPEITKDEELGGGGM